MHQFLLNLIIQLPYFIITILFLIMTHFIAKLTSYIIGSSLSKTKMRTNLVQVFQKLSVILIWILGILISAAILFPSVTPANLLATLGLGSVAVGFAFKDIFENFMAGILILLREPFHVGDYIQTKTEEGEVEHISVRNTHLRRSDGVRVVMPNAILFNNPIEVLTDYDFRRTQTKFCVPHDIDIKKMHDTIKKALGQCESINGKKFIHIYLNEITTDGLVLEILWWTQSKPSDIRLSHHEVLSSIITAFENENIKFAHAFTLCVEKPVDVQLHDKPAKR